mgnify:CR=1 FL=1
MSAEGTETTTEAPPQVSPVPPAFYWSAWIGVFAVLTWGMMHLFGSHRQP